ncbi:BA75_00530T0 [Komagataella pastoris]|uniref:BA75_00530T0 n=1 Tax=Komagataella pastoris TaxID=4922 RepID=A0A1B2J6T3_PICPA|nr:BA75_00530T0 [Komagataella pastoris]
MSDKDIPASLTISPWSIKPAAKKKKVSQDNSKSVKIPDTHLYGKVIRHDKEKRNKACNNCRKSKIKCESSLEQDNTPCKRCLHNGLQCVYEYKIPSYKVIGGSSVNEVLDNSKNDFKPTEKADISKILNPQSSQVLTTSTYQPNETPIENSSSQGWKSSVENRLQNFDSTLTDILSLLRDQQNEKNQKASIAATIDSILTLEDAHTLFDYFDTNITPQLFGFDLSSYSVDDLRTTSPILFITICCISSIHHIDFKHLHGSLKGLLEKLSQDVLQNPPNNEVEAFNTIIALCISGFWFQKNQIFTGLALQLAKNMNLNVPVRKNKRRRRNSNSKSISDKDRLKLWYLLFILDGHQSLAFNRQPLLSSNDPALTHSRELLSSESIRDKYCEALRENPSTELILNGSPPGSSSDTDTPSKVGSGSRTSDHSHELKYSDLRLVSQVEYNQAISEVFRGNAWDLLTPASFGIPFKSNVELDKWMVQWTVLLSPMHSNNIWSSKSTLIYYNFAKMHINSLSVRKLHTDGSSFPEWRNDEDDDDEALDNPEYENNKAEVSLYKESSSSSDSDDSDSDDESETNTPVMSKREGLKVSSQIAVSAAETVLNLVLSDNDIISALRFVPVHVHVMLYYAAMLVINSPTLLRTHFTGSKNYKGKKEDPNLTAFKMVKKLRNLIYHHKPIDRKFAEIIILGLDKLLADKHSTLKNESSVDPSTLQKVFNVLHEDEVNFRGESKIIDKIFAWPGTNHGHP